MDEYPNVNKRLRIVSINEKEMSLSDGSKWQFLKASSPPPSWKQPETYVVIEKTKMKTMYRVMKGEQDRSAVYMGGGVSKEQIIEINKSLQEYPTERLGRDLRVEKLLEDGCIKLEDQSVWQLSGVGQKRTGDWSTEHYVQVSRGAGIGLYNVVNPKVSKIPFTAKFLGFQS